MALPDKHITAVAEGDLAELITAQVAESKSIEYKRELPGNSDGDKKEYLYDLSSFANSEGGHIIYGIDEAAGLPTGLPGLVGIDPDKVVLRLEQLARDGIRPPIAGLQFAAVRLLSGHVAIVARIPRSWNPPHQVIYQKTHRFYGRGSSGKQLLDVEELRSIFSMSESFAEKARMLRIDRLARIVSGDGAASLIHEDALVMHLIPLSAFGLRSNISFTEIAQHPNYFSPIGNAPRNWTVNADGLLVLSNGDPEGTVQRAYVQVFRNGVVESVMSGVARGEPPTIRHLAIEHALVKHSRIYAAGLQLCGAEPPFVLLASLIGVKGKVVAGNAAWHGESYYATLRRDQLHLSDIVFESVPKDFQSSATTLRPILDQLANAAGSATTTTFDATGKYLQTFS